MQPCNNSNKKTKNYVYLQLIHRSKLVIRESLFFSKIFSFDLVFRNNFYFFCWKLKLKRKNIVLKLPVFFDEIQDMIGVCSLVMVF
jgi:hypothetical protein